MNTTEQDVIENTGNQTAEDKQVTSLPNWEETIGTIETAEEAIAEYVKKLNQKREEENKSKKEAGIEVSPEDEKEIKIPFSHSFSQDLISVKKVKIKLPAPGAQFLNPIEGHQIFAFEDENLDGLKHIEILPHYANGDSTARCANGSIRPTVVRHFFVGPDLFGSFIIANVTVTKKTEILSGRQMLNINIHPIKKAGRVAVLKNNYLRNGEPAPMVKNPDGTEEPAKIVTAYYELKLGVAGNGSQFEVKIPESDKFVRFETIKPLSVIV